MQGHRVGGLLHLRRLSDAGRTVVCPGMPRWHDPQPAETMMRLTGYEIQEALDAGLYVYERQPEENTNDRKDTSPTA